MIKPRLRIRRACFWIITLILLIGSALPAWGQDYLPLFSPSVILVEQTTGKVLYAKDERTRMYPASMTKILTALVVMDYLAPDDIITVGPEIYTLPPDYATAIHFEGESITVRNLLRALMIRSGNETGVILALNVIRVRENRTNIPNADAQRLFASLMNEKAQALGATNSNFTNPYGYHEENHYTTAYDLALLCRAYMENDLLREIAGTRLYEGDSLDGLAAEGAKTKLYSWENHNKLILNGDFYYPYATGIKTGFTDEAGDCLAASARRNDIELVAVIFNSPEPGRWQDAKLLFDYGYETYGFKTIQEKDERLDIAYVANHLLGESSELEVLANETYVDFLSPEELSALTRSITYNDAYRYTEPAEAKETKDTLSFEETAAAEAGRRLAAPIEKDALVGTVTYTLNGTVVFEGTLRAASDVAERTFDTDTDYYLKQFTDNVFTVKALPYWFGGVGLLVGIIGIAAALAGRRNRRRDRWHDNRPHNRYRGYR